ncbi:hypothetical protein ACW0US_17550 [Xanthomonas euvesicatoria]
MSSHNRFLAPRDVQRADAQRVNHLEEPRPGTYWRLTQAIHGDEDDKQIRANAMEAGTVLLLEDIEYADGSPHVYKFAPHPSLPKGLAWPSRFHADCFWTYWTYCPEGEQVRERELLALGQEMDRTRALLQSPPPALKPVANLGYDPSATPAPGQALATTAQLRDLTAYAQVLRDNAEATQHWISTHSDALQAQGSAVARFHMERATAGLAAARGQLDAVKGILRTVENLKLYTGDEVVVTPLRDGEPAPADAPLTIYQELLALDEELLLHLELNGLDHTHLDSIAAVLADTALLDRMLPAPRSIVLCKFRGDYKEFVRPRDANDIGAAMTNARLNEINQLSMLLVRDGGRVYLVDGPSFLGGMKQLMPNAAEQLDHYVDRAGEKIRSDSIDYAKAQRSQLGALDAYAKVLTMLWGLRDRGVLFAQWNAPAFASWLDWGFQERYMVLVDQSVMLTVERPDYASYRKAQNRYLAAGAWVAVRVSALFTQDYLPAAFASQSTRQWDNKWAHNQVYRLVDPAVAIACVQRDKRGPYIEVRLVHEDQRRTYGNARQINGKLYLEGEARREVLVLDRVHAEDLTYYLTSRQQRRQYNGYMQLFQAARVWVAERDAAEAPLRGQLRQAVLDAQIPHAPDALDATITAALAVARTARRDKRSPAPGAAGYAAYRRGALDSLHALLTSHTEHVKALDAWGAHMGRRPLRLVSTGKGEFKAYFEPLPAEHSDMLGSPRHTSSAIVDFGATDAGDAFSQWQRELLRPAAGEHVIHDWQYLWIEKGDPKSHDYWAQQDREHDDGAADWLARKSLFPTIRYDQAEALLTIPQHQSKWFIRHVRGGDVDAMRGWSLGSKSGYVVRHVIRCAIGIALRRGKPAMLVAEHDVLAYCYANSDEAGMEACLQLIRQRYKHPEASVGALQSNEFSWELKLQDFDQLWPLRDADHAGNESAGWSVRAKDVVDPANPNAKDRERDVRIMGLTELGAELFPWLGPLTSRAL